MGMEKFSQLCIATIEHKVPKLELPVRSSSVVVVSSLVAHLLVAAWFIMIIVILHIYHSIYIFFYTIFTYCVFLGTFLCFLSFLGTLSISYRSFDPGQIKVSGTEKIYLPLHFHFRSIYHLPTLMMPLYKTYIIKHHCTK